MTKRLVDIDDGMLRAAQDARDYSTIEETVAEGLREIVTFEARKREMYRLGAGYLDAFADDTERQHRLRRREQMHSESLAVLNDSADRKESRRVLDDMDELSRE